MSGNIGNSFLKAVLNSPLYPLLGNSFALITFTGRKTGRVYATPVNVTKDGDRFTIVSLKSRNWWRNLRGGSMAMLRVTGKEHPVRAEVVEDDIAVAAGLEEHFKRHPRYAQYLHVRLAQDGQPVREDLERAAEERVVIHLQLAGAE